MSETTSTNQTPAASPPESGSNAPKRNRFEKKSGKSIPKFIKIGIPLVLAAAIALGVVHFIRGNLGKDGSDIIEATVMEGPISNYVTGWGSISPVSKADYGAEIKGEVMEVAVAPGDLVSEGDLLFTIDPSEMKTDLLAAKTELAGLEKQLRDLDKNYENAVRALEDAREAYNKCTVTAPFSGIMINTPEAMPKTGDNISAGTALGTLADNSNMKLRLYFNRIYIDQIKPGQKASVSVPDNMALLEGTVASVDKGVSPFIDGAPCFEVTIKVPNGGGLAPETEASAAVAGPQGDIMPSQSGKLDYWQTKEIIFEGVSSDITAMSVKQYGLVSQGAVLCSVDSKPASDAVDEAQYNVETYERQMSDDFIQNDIAKAQKKIDELELICSTSSFYSTITGQVTAVMIKPGDKLNASNTAVLTVSDTSSLVLNVNIDEADISNVKTGMGVDITYDTTDGGGYAYGEVTYVSFEAKTQSDNNGMGAFASFPATITLQNDGTLLPGMGVNYSILAVSRDSCLFLPSQCIINTEEGPVVYVKNGQDFGYEKVEFDEGIVPEGYYAVRVEVGIADTANTEIISGLESGTVVYQGSMSNEMGMYY